jgi:hypothetical protein
MAVIQDDDIHPAVIRPAFGSLIAAYRHGIRKARYLETPFLYSNIGKIMKNTYRPGGRKFPIRFPRPIGIHRYGVRMAFDAEFPAPDLLGVEQGA